MSVLALAFDFDDTLAPDSSSFFLERNGVDPTEFWSKIVGARIAEGWDPVPAYLYEIKQLGERLGRPFTRNDFIEAGHNLSFHEGLPQFFEELRQDLKQRRPGTEIEYYLISSGIGDLIRATAIASFFTDIWTCDWHYDEKGVIDFPRNIISFTDKTRFIYRISKGLVGPQYRARPFDVNRKVDLLRIPMETIVYVGDGLTDVPVFSLLKQHKATCFAVFNPHSDNRSKAWGFIEEERVRGLYSPRFSRQSDLYQNILLALESAADKAARN